MNTSEVATTPDGVVTNCSFNEELWEAEFNKRITAFAKVSGLTELKVREVLGNLGATGEDERSLKLLDSDEFLPMGDLFEAFCDSKIISKGILRMSVTELRGRRAGDTAECCTEEGSSDVANAIREVVASNRPKTDWSDKELLEKYDQDETEIAKILSTRTRGRPCIVFQEDGSVNVDVSLKLVKIARRQSTAETHAVGDKAVWVFPSGKFPAKPVDASPFYPELALVDDYCAKSNTNWNSVLHEHRVIAYLYVHKVETTDLSHGELHDICDDALKGCTKSIYSKARLIYKDLEEKGELPKLTITPNSVIPNGSKDTGF
ncbi:hypothetical protein LCGC14_1224900 [marine sediment metagenome]|uniref:Uncharacterized protein n=1 Tax=marine sediment metagenome TaxID=412755 RepID=A0A0F9LA87_9ZZZZ